MSAAPSRIRAASRSDLPEVVDLLNACDVAEVGQPDTTADDIESDWGMEGFELAHDAWVATGDGRVLAGYAYVGDQFRTGELEADLWVRPEREEPALATRLLNLAERRGRELAASRGYETPMLDVFCIGVNHAKRELLLRRGYALSRTVYRMSADLGHGVVALPVPEGIAIRAFRVDADARVMFDAMNEAFEDHFRQSEEPFDAWSARLLGHADFDADLWFLAWDGDEAVAALIAYDHGDLGWVKGLGVRRPWRRRGLGGAMLAHTFAALAARGQRRVELGVDAEGETQPLRMYERAGMHVTFTYELYAKPLGA
ncbi:MAG: GNAT family N-acetyltransferase [Actinobacteria bacterium]|nr:GNAT family N-acetyltransferase [Actinomycetota bacterium]